MAATNLMRVVGPMSACFCDTCPTFVDGFDDIDSADYQIFGGSISVSGNRLVMSGDTLAITHGGNVVTNGLGLVVFTHSYATGGAPTGLNHIYGAWTDEDNNIRVDLDFDNGVIQLYEVVAGVETLLDEMYLSKIGTVPTGTLQYMLLCWDGRHAHFRAYAYGGGQHDLTGPTTLSGYSAGFGSTGHTGTFDFAGWALSANRFPLQSGEGGPAPCSRCSSCATACLENVTALLVDLPDPFWYNVQCTECTDFNGRTFFLPRQSQLPDNRYHSPDGLGGHLGQQEGSCTYRYESPMFCSGAYQLIIIGTLSPGSVVIVLEFRDADGFLYGRTMYRSANIGEKDLTCCDPDNPVEWTCEHYHSVLMPAATGTGEPCRNRAPVVGSPRSGPITVRPTCDGGTSPLTPPTPVCCDGTALAEPFYVTILRDGDPFDTLTLTLGYHDSSAYEFTDVSSKGRLTCVVATTPEGYAVFTYTGPGLSHAFDVTVHDCDPYHATGSDSLDEGGGDMHLYEVEITK